MNSRNTKTIAALALAGALSIGTASAMGLDTGTKPLGSVVGVNGPSVSVNIEDGVATLFGNVESNIESHLAQSHVESIDGVDRVINLITYQ